MRLAFDVTALHDPLTGIGRVTTELLARLSADPTVDPVAYSVSWRGRDRVADLVPAGVRTVRRPMAAGPLRSMWRRADWPPIEWWTGPVDVVHGPNFVVPPARRAASLVTVHDLTCIRFPDLVTSDVAQYPALLRRALARGTHVHTVSRFVAEEVIDVFDADPARVHVIPNGLTPAAGGDPASGRRIAGGSAYVLALGTIEPRKDLPSLVAAFDRVAGRHRDLHLVVAGPSGWGAAAFDAAVAAAANRARIVRLGWVDEATRADLLAGASLLAYPSRYEGFGLPPLEAMAAGVPVVATRAGALVETLEDAADLVDVGDVEMLAAAIDRVVTDGDHRAELVRRGHGRAASFSWDTSATELAALYRRLAGAARKGR